MMQATPNSSPRMMGFALLKSHSLSSKTALSGSQAADPRAMNYSRTRARGTLMRRDTFSGIKCSFYLIGKVPCENTSYLRKL